MITRMTHQEVYKVSTKNNGTLYEESAKRAYAWYLSGLINEVTSGSVNLTLTESLAIIDNSTLVRDTLNQFEKSWAEE